MGAGKHLEHTSAVSVFTVFIFFLVMSQLIEHIFHKLEHRFEHNNQKGLKAALGKVKEELMLMGFCSLILVVLEDEILSICADMRHVHGIPAENHQNRCGCAELFMQMSFKRLSKLDTPLLPWAPTSPVSSPASSPASPSASSPSSSSASSSAASSAAYWFDESRSKYAHIIDQCCENYPNLDSTALCSYSSYSASYNSSYSERLLYGPAQNFGRRLGAVEVNTCPDGQAPFIEQAALHQTHTIIFYIAMVHITLGVCVMYTAKRRVSSFAKWEHFGNKPEEDPSSFNIPPRRQRCLQRYFWSCTEQFTQSVDTCSFVAIRRFYVSRNVTAISPQEYTFSSVMMDHMSQKFAEILGIEPWMWFTLGLQLILEGYGLGTMNLFSQLAMIVMLTAGMKLQMVNDQLTRIVYETYDCVGPDASGKGSIDRAAFMKLQSDRNCKLLMNIEPKFWRHDPTILETMLKFCLWQNSVSLTLFGYFGIKYEQFDKFHTCFWESRTIPGTMVDVTIIVSTLCLSAFAVVPVYCLVSLSAEHNHIMQRKKSKRLSKHGHGHGNSHGHGHGQGGSNGHSNGHGGEHDETHSHSQSDGEHKDKEDEITKDDANADVGWGRS